MTDWHARRAIGLQFFEVRDLEELHIAADEHFRISSDRFTKDDCVDSKGGITLSVGGGIARTFETGPGRLALRVLARVHLIEVGSSRNQ